jgi:hypothetical protein
VEQTRLLAILDEIRPKRALLTSFTFGPGWFEGFCFPVLRLGGCESIDVLVDSRHSARSTAESSSQYAGNAYRVIPVFMKSGGFFHPKLAYLERDSADGESKGDVLVVGSGNLTFAGQGSNLEVLDAVNSNEHPFVFQQLGRFFREFAGREGLAMETRRVLAQYASRAEAAAAAAPPEALENARVWLVHTLDSTAADQFAARCADIGPVNQLTVLSPYHDPEGLSVTLLKEELKAESLHIGMSASKCIAPFDADRQSLPEGTVFVVPQNRESRFAHAKIFEAVSGKGCVVMTGSVNATEQSLYSKGNVEVGLIRRLEVSPFEWAEEEPKGFEPCRFEAAEMAPRVPALDAQLQPDGTVRGTVSPVPPAAVARLQISCAARPEVDESVSVDGEGAFVLRNVHLNADWTGARMVELTSGDFIARGWLNVEAELRLTPREKDYSRAAARVSAGRATASDLWAIYDVLKQGLKRAPVPRKAEANDSTEGKPPADKAVADVPYKSWNTGDFGDLGASNPLEMQCLTAAFRHLNGDVVFPKKKSDGNLELLMNKGDEFDQSGLDNDNEPEDDRDTGNTGNGSTSDADKESAEAAMLQALPDGLARDATHPLLAGVVQLSASEALKRAFGRRDSFRLTENRYFVGNDLAFGLDSWLARFSVFAYSESNRRNLLPAFCAMACCAVWLASDEGKEAVRGRAKEAVRMLAKELPDAETWHLKAERAFVTHPFVRIAQLPTEQREAILSAAPSILGAISPTESLECLIAAVFAGGAMPLLPEAYGPVIKALAKYKLKTPSKYDHRRFGVVAAADIGFRCPGCNEPFEGAVELSALRASRAAVHVRCNKAVFLGLSVVGLKAVLPLNVKFGVTP